eukprot:m.46634 g.46634  ORF g.46634 m.46634 type:complete len:122 (-) comp15468_c0_seq1:183-548(-)
MAPASVLFGKSGSCSGSDAIALSVGCDVRPRVQWWRWDAKWWWWDECPDGWPQANVRTLTSCTVQSPRFLPPTAGAAASLAHCGPIGHTMDTRSGCDRRRPGQETMGACTGQLIATLHLSN